MDLRPPAAAVTTLFCLRPATRNIGNDVIAKATTDLLRSVFGADTNVVDLPALASNRGYGGLTARQVYDVNRLADGVVIGGGNLFENGQLTIDAQAVEALRVPLLLVGLSHGRIHDRDGTLIDRTDSMPPDAIRRLVRKSVATLVRDRSSQAVLRSFGVDGVEVGGCPTLFMDANDENRVDDGRVLISVRNPDRMSVPATLQWRVADDVRRLIAALKAVYGDSVFVVCHDYADIEFATAFAQAPLLYFDDAGRYIDALRRCRLSVSYRLHAFLPCLAFGTPSIHLSYDERGREAVATAGMSEWDVDLLHERDVVEAVTMRSRTLDRYDELRCRALPIVAELRDTTVKGLERFAEAVGTWQDRASQT
jgi:polysaccharide pyruvyl transferase WcaK-like protein